MPKKQYIVLSDKGSKDCQHLEYDTYNEAVTYASAQAERQHATGEFAIYQKVAVTETHPKRACVRKFANG